MASWPISKNQNVFVVIKILLTKMPVGKNLQWIEQGWLTLWLYEHLDYYLRFFFFKVNLFSYFSLAPHNILALKFFSVPHSLPQASKDTAITINYSFYFKNVLLKESCMCISRIIKESSHSSNRRWEIGRYKHGT